MIVDNDDGSQTVRHGRQPEVRPSPTIHCTHCDQDKPVHLFFDKGEHEAQAHMFIRNIAAKEGYPSDAMRCKEVCNDCWHEASNGYFVTIEREGNAFYCTQAI
jgi:hypothetical protein